MDMDGEWVVVEMWDWDLRNGCGAEHKAATLSSLYRNLTPAVHKNALVIAYAPVFAPTYLNLHLSYKKSSHKTDLGSENNSHLAESVLMLTHTHNQISNRRKEGRETTNKTLKKTTGSILSRLWFCGSS